MTKHTFYTSRSIICIVVLCFGILSIDCSSYLIKQGSAIFNYSCKAESIEKLQKNPDTPDSLKQFLKLVQTIRRYAFDSLGEKRNSNYSKYVVVNKNYLVDVVYAAGSDNLDLYQWHYPFFGGFPYRGYFDYNDAKEEAQRLKNKGYDVYIGYVEGFSTLGFSSDLVYSFMQDFSMFKLANFIIHEEFHNTVYFKNQVQFNEETASFVGATGALRFIKSFYGDSSLYYRAGLRELADKNTFSDCMRSLYFRLKTIYNLPIAKDEKLRQKHLVITAFKDSLENHYDSMFKTQDYRGLSEVNINNAFVAISMTYALDMDLYYSLYNKNSRDLRKTIEALKKMNKGKEDLKETLFQDRRQIETPIR